VSASRGNRLVCYCDDCQSFAHFLGHADQILDPHGGTDIFQTSPARLQLTTGADQLACMRLKPGGMFRWYTDCCKTPIGNTLGSPGIPFVGLIHSCTDQAASGRARDELLGPVRSGVNARFAKGDRTQLDAHDRAPPSMLFRFAWILLRARLRGDQRRSPFFDAETGKPIAVPRVLTEDELGSVERTRDATDPPPSHP